MDTASVFDIPQFRPLGRFQPETAHRAGVLPLFWSGGGLELSFSGGRLEFILDAGFQGMEPWISVEVNGAPMIRMPLGRGKTILPLRLSAPSHIRLLKETQPMPEERDAFLWLSGLRWSGGEFLPLSSPIFRLEFVGDSLTSGEGLYGAKEEEMWSSAWFSARTAFPQRTADLLSAECRVVGQSGWGLRSDWNNNPHHALPDWYNRVCGPAAGRVNAALGAQEEYRFSEWRADAVIVNLGTNDSGAIEQPPWQGPDGETFQQRDTPEGIAWLENAAVDFLKDLRWHNPGAKLVWAYGMLGDPLRPCLEGAVSRYRRETGDKNAWYLSLPPVTEETMGARLHPGPACHQAAAETLADFLKQIL